MFCLISHSSLQIHGYLHYDYFKNYIVLFSTHIYILIFNLPEFIICVWHDMCIKLYFFHGYMIDLEQFIKKTILFSIKKYLQ